MATSSPRNLLPIVLAYLPLPILGAIGSARWGVGASPAGGPGDMFLRGTALTPPLFLPVLLVTGAGLARGSGRRARLGAGIAATVGGLFLAGSTANLPNDFAAAKAAGTPRWVTALLAVIHAGLAVALLVNAVPTVVGRRRGSGNADA